MIPIHRYLILSAIVGLMIGLVFANLFNGCNRREPEGHYVYNQPEPDTVRKKEFIHDTVRLVKTVYRFKPSKVVVYEKPDTLRRAAIAADTLISGLELSGNCLEIQTISPLGISTVADFKLPEPAMLHLTIDHKGNLEVQPDWKAIRRLERRKKWRKVGNWVLMAGAFAVGVLVK